MDREYLILFMEKTCFPLEAQEFILNAFDTIKKTRKMEFLELLMIEAA